MVILYHLYYKKSTIYPKYFTCIKSFLCIFHIFYLYPQKKEYPLHPLLELCTLPLCPLLYMHRLLLRLSICSLSGKLNRHIPPSVYTQQCCSYCYSYKYFFNFICLFSVTFGTRGITAISFVCNLL